MPRPEDELLPGIQDLSEADAVRYFTDPLFHAKVHLVAQVLGATHGTERPAALAFGAHVIKLLEQLSYDSRNDGKS